MPQPQNSENPSPVLIIGAGPAGLATAACLQQRGVSARLVDRDGEPGGAYRKMYPNITLSSPACYNSLPGLKLRTIEKYVTVREYRDYLSEYANFHRLPIEQGTVTKIAREGEAYAVRFTGGETARYRAIVVATGMFDYPRMPQIVGLNSTEAFPSRPDVLHSADWPGPEKFRGARLLIVGRASSAVEIAEECARAGVAVVVAARDKHVRVSRQKLLGRDIHDFARLVERLPRWALGSFCGRHPTLPAADLGFNEHVRAGTIQVENAAIRIDGRRVEFVGGNVADFDAVVLATGYRFAAPYLPADVPRTLADHPVADRNEIRGWPNLYVVGFPCARSLASEYLRGIAEDALLVAQRFMGCEPS